MPRRRRFRRRREYRLLLDPKVVINCSPRIQVRIRLPVMLRGFRLRPIVLLRRPLPQGVAEGLCRRQTSPFKTKSSKTGITTSPEVKAHEASARAALSSRKPSVTLATREASSFVLGWHDAAHSQNDAMYAAFSGDTRLLARPDLMMGIRPDAARSRFSSGFWVEAFEFMD